MQAPSVFVRLTARRWTAILRCKKACAALDRMHDDENLRKLSDKRKKIFHRRRIFRKPSGADENERVRSQRAVWQTIFFFSL